MSEHHEHYDAAHAVELAPGVFHVGVSDQRHAWANVPYLLVDGEEAVLIDPGSARDDFFEVVLRKVREVVDPRRIRAFVVQHQDPDLCAALPRFEPLVHPDVKIYTPLEATLLVQHYGLSSPLVGVEDDETLTFGDGRELRFVMTPYLHFVGSMMTLDARSKTLFTSDAFGGFTMGTNVYADDDYATSMTMFLGHYLGSKPALEYALRRIERLAREHRLERLCPQHGCVIPKEIFHETLAEAHLLEVGGALTDLAHKHGITLRSEEPLLS